MIRQEKGVMCGTGGGYLGTHANVLENMCK